MYSNPDEAIRKVVDSHPDILEARKVKKQAEEAKAEAELQSFQSKHPDYNEIGSSPEFRNWVMEEEFRRDLYSRGDQFDLTAADALFSLYKSEKGLNQVREQQVQADAIAAAELESSSATMVQTSDNVMSRSEYIDKLTRARQGDYQAEEWVKRNSAKYREALASGNVRD